MRALQTKIQNYLAKPKSSCTDLPPKKFKRRWMVQRVRPDNSSLPIFDYSPYLPYGPVGFGAGPAPFAFATSELKNVASATESAVTLTISNPNPAITFA